MRREREGKERIGEGKRDSGGGGTYRKFNRKLCTQSCTCVCVCVCVFLLILQICGLFLGHTPTHTHSLFLPC